MKEEYAKDRNTKKKKRGRLTRPPAPLPHPPVEFFVDEWEILKCYVVNAIY